MAIRRVRDKPPGGDSIPFGEMRWEFLGPDSRRMDPGTMKPRFGKGVTTKGAKGAKKIPRIRMPGVRRRVATHRHGNSLRSDEADSLEDNRTTTGDKPPTIPFLAVSGVEP